MKKLNPQKLHVEFRPGVTPTEPIMPRRYTLTHSDVTAELFLVVSPVYANDKISEMRDEVLAEWNILNDRYYLKVYCYIDGGEFSPSIAAKRNTVFVKELPLALEAIRYGDRLFFGTHPRVDYSRIYVYFASTDKHLNRVEYWGTVKDYK